jgi:hypothetical protein
MFLLHQGLQWIHSPTRDARLVNRTHSNQSKENYNKKESREHHLFAKINIDTVSRNTLSKYLEYNFCGTLIEIMPAVQRTALEYVREP